MTASSGVSDMAVLGALCIPDTHKTKYPVLLFTFLGSLHCNSPFSHRFSVRNVEILSVKDPQPSASLRDWIVKICKSIHTERHAFLAQLTGAGTLSFHQNFKVGHLMLQKQSLCLNLRLHRSKKNKERFTQENWRD